MPNDLAIILVSALLAMAIVLARLLFDRLERLATSRRRKAQRMAQVRASRLPVDDAAWERAAPTPPQPAPTPVVASASVAVTELPSAAVAPTPAPVLAIAPPPVEEPAAGQPLVVPPPAPVQASAGSDGWQTHPIVPIEPAPADAPALPSDGAPEPVAPNVPQEPAAWRLHPATASAGFATSDLDLAQAEPSLPVATNGADHPNGSDHAPNGSTPVVAARLVTASFATRPVEAPREVPADSSPGPEPLAPVMGPPLSHASAPAPEPRGGLGEILDASLGMYLFRRLFRRPTATRAQRRYEEASSIVATQRLHREFGIEPVQQAHPITPTRLVVSGAVAGAADGPAVTPVPRGRSQGGQLARDGAIALAMFGVIAIVVAGFVTLWRGGEGAVLDASGTPRASLQAAGGSSASPTAIPTVAPSPTVVPSAAPSATPTPTPSPSPTPTAEPTPEPTRAPNATSAPDPTAAPPAGRTATPKPTPPPTPKPTVAPTPPPPPPLVAFPDCSVSGFTVDCDGSASRSGVVYVWSFEQGPTLSGANVSYTYGDPGNYTITLTVIEGSDEASESVTANVPQ